MATVDDKELPATDRDSSAVPEDAPGVRCVVVTPERAVLDRRVEFVTLPLFDGEIGILHNHAPLVGRLGAGELRLVQGDRSESRYFIDGGFVQVNANVVTVLTPQAIPAGDLDPAAADRERADAESLPMANEAELARRNRALERAKAKRRISGKAS